MYWQKRDAIFESRQVLSRRVKKIQRRIASRDSPIHWFETSLQVQEALGGSDDGCRGKGARDLCH